MRSSLALPQALRPSRRPRCAVVDSLLYAPTSGRLATLPLAAGASRNGAVLDLDVHAEVGEGVVGPDATFATALAELVVRGRDLREARAISTEMLADSPRVTAEAGAASASGAS